MPLLFRSFPLALARLLPVFAALALLLPLAAPARAQSLDVMAGQMIMVGFQGSSADAASVRALREAIGAGRIGGVMYLRHNIASLSAVRAMNAAFRAAAPAGLAPFIALDQEGGAVERLTQAVGFAEVPNARTVAARYDAAGAETLYADMARRIAALGFTLNFGPVADMAVNPDNPVIARHGRAFGADAETVITFAAAFVRGHRAAGLLTALKHFPGHGSSRADSHEGFVDITATWRAAELEPFRALVAAGYDEFVMMGHLYHAERAGGAGLPASLSRAWIEGVLRGELGFRGVVISDDLEMSAIRDHFSLRETVVGAVRAGMDMLLFSNTARYRAGLGEEVLAILLEEARADPAFAARIEESYRRIVALKARLG